MRMRLLAVVVSLALPVAVQAQDEPMTYDQFTQAFQTRGLAALTTIRDGLVGSGVAANNVTVTVPDATNLRIVLSATRAGRTCVVYFELTPVGIQDGEMVTVITLYVEGNGSEITHSYTTGIPLKAVSQIPELLTKLTEGENTIGEILVKARAFLRV